MLWGLLGYGGREVLLLSSRASLPLTTRRTTPTITGLKGWWMRDYSSSATPPGGFEDLDKPIKFTTSKAADWKATSTHGGTVNPDMPSSQPLIVSLSVSIFLIYFLALREENDVDERMKTPLWDRVPGLEKKQLEVVLAYNTQHGLPTQDIQDRLLQISNSPPPPPPS